MTWRRAGCRTPVSRDWMLRWLARDAALPESTSTRRPSTTTELKAMFGGDLPKTLRIPKSKWALDELVDKETWANEIDTSAFTPPGIQRDLVRKFPAELEGQEVPLSAMFNVPDDLLS